MKYTRFYALILLLAILLTACDANVTVKVPGITPSPDKESTVPGDGENTEGEDPDGENADGGQKPSEDEEDELPEEYINDDITFDIGEQAHVVIHDANNNHAASAINFLTSVTDKWPILMTDDYEARNNELVIGRCDREVSRDAYSYLEQYERDSMYVARYGFYSHGNSVAIAYDVVAEYEPYIIECAINCLREKYYTEGEALHLEAGTLYIDTVDLAEYQAELDNIRQQEVWERFTNEAGEEAAEALKLMYDTLYDRDALVTWLANLFDVDLGGFYYALSARDDYQVKYNGTYYDLLPDIESTSQALGFIGSSGMIYGYSGVNDAFPAWMKTAIVKFAKERQAPNGYFYHPQWTQKMVDDQLSRRGRDLGNAIGILNMFYVSPTYNTPTGVNGDGRLWDGTLISASASALTMPISTSTVASVSKVVATAAAVPSHLQDETSFRAYLKKFENSDGNINGNSYWIGNQLASQSGQIVARDKTLAKENGG